MSEERIVPTHAPLSPVLPWRDFLKTSKQLDPSEVVRIISHHIKQRANSPEQIIALIHDHPKSEIIWSNLKSYGLTYQGYVLEVLQKASQNKNPQNDKLKQYRFIDLSIEEVIENFSEETSLVN